MQERDFEDYFEVFLCGKIPHYSSSYPRKSGYREEFLEVSGLKEVCGKTNTEFMSQEALMKIFWTLEEN